jgi:hypothetical protein
VDEIARLLIYAIIIIVALLILARLVGVAL